jgi:hypothetical protein
MTPARAAVLFVLILIPAGLWGYVNTLRGDLVTRSRAVVWQAQHGSEAARGRFYNRYRDPLGTPEAQKKLFDRLWLTLRNLRATKVTHGDGGTMKAADGDTHEHRQILIQGKDAHGRLLTVRLEWVRCDPGWRILDYSTSF